MTGGVETVASPIRWPGLTGVSERRFALAIIGDVRLELRTRLPATSLSTFDADRFEFAPIEPVLAGTAVNLARRAVRYFRSVDVIGVIGDDCYTSGITRQVHDLGVGAHLRIRTGMPNGFVVMLTSGGDGPGPRHGSRVMIASMPAPSLTLTAADVMSWCEPLARADVLVVDGYSMLSAESRAALVLAAVTARRAGARVALDLVPHDLDARVGLADAADVLAAVDLVVAEADTVTRLLGRPRSARIDELLPALDAFAAVTWLLRFGVNRMDDVLVYRADALRMVYPTGYSDAPEKIGFGDAIFASELYWWLSRAVH